MQKGFTLIELMIVVAVIGVLAAIALPAYQKSVAKAQVAEALTLMSGLKSGVVIQYASNGRCGVNNKTSAFGVAQATDIQGKYVEQVEVSADGNFCKIEAMFRNQAVATELQGKILRLKMTAVKKGHWGWSCESDDISADYLPAGCRKV